MAVMSQNNVYVYGSVNYFQRTRHWQRSDHQTALRTVFYKKRRFIYERGFLMLTDSGQKIIGRQCHKDDSSSIF